MDAKTTAQLAKPLIDLINLHQTQNNQPCYVALDGRSGSGKSTMATYITDHLQAVAVIEGDEFYSGGNLSLWSSRSANENAQRCINWRKQHLVISALKSKGVASWQAFDWNSEHWDSENAPNCSELSNCTITNVVLLEGVYSARSELSALFDIRAMLQVPQQVCDQRIIAREGTNRLADWEKLWADAEQYYIENQLDQQSLNLILN